MTENVEHAGQWPDAICSGRIRYGRASNYDGFYLADAQHGIPTFGSVSPTDPPTICGQFVRVFNYPGQTEEIASELVKRWNAFPAYEAMREALANAREELDGICNELGCTSNPGVALRFVKELRRDLTRAHDRHVELIRSWDFASPTERQELDRLRRGWGPSTPTERMARRTDLIEAMNVISRAMDAVLPDDKEDENLTRDHFHAAYEKLSVGYSAIIALIHALPALSDPDKGGQVDG